MKIGGRLMLHVSSHSAWRSPTNIQMVCQKHARMLFTDKPHCKILPFWHISLA